MPTTPIYSLPYPAAADPADVPTDMGDLALAVEDALGDVGGGSLPYALVRDQKASGTAGGSAAATTWNVRTLTTEVHDDTGFLALSANRVTLNAGTYRCRASACAYGVQRHKLRLRNVTDNTTVLVGTSGYAALTGGDSPVTDSVILGEFVIVAGKQLELQHYTQIASATQGLGIAASSGELEIYALLEFWKVA